MSSVAAENATVQLNGKDYPSLADGKYDVVICGTGLTECILSGLLCKKGMKVLHTDRNDFYGSACASLTLSNLFKKFKNREPTEEEFTRLGKDRYYNVDLVPKLILGAGQLVKIILYTKTEHYLEFNAVDGSFAAQGGKPSKVPSTASEAVKTPLVGFFQKRRLRGLLQFLAGYDAKDTKTHQGQDLNKVTSRELFKYFSCDDNTAEFVGHCMALMPDNTYLDEPACKMVDACQLYVESLTRYGGISPYLYPNYGLGGLPEGFSRLSAVYGGTFMLMRDVHEIVRNEDGVVVGVTSKNPEEKDAEEAAVANIVVGDPSYFGKDRCELRGHVVRSICILEKSIPNLGQDCRSCQIIIPQGQCKRNHDIYITMIGEKLHCTPEGRYVVTISTTVETSVETALQELEPAIKLIGAKNILERFDEVSPFYVPKKDLERDNCFCSRSYDATSNFESILDDVFGLYERITGERLVMDEDAKEGKKS
jgi:Rab GDP dissociation inhibitor|eukprot:g4321.t1